MTTSVIESMYLLNSSYIPDMVPSAAYVISFNAPNRPTNTPVCYLYCVKKLSIRNVSHLSKVTHRRVGTCDALSPGVSYFRAYKCHHHSVFHLRGPYTA